MLIPFVLDDTPTDPDDDGSVPNTITTKADVEAEPSDRQVSLPDDSVHSNNPKLRSESKHSCDADLSNDYKEDLPKKVRKPRRRAQRAKSAQESSSLPSKHSMERAIRSRPSLPAKPKLDSVINKDTGVSIVRPWSDQTICRTKQLLESDEIFVIGHEVMNRTIPLPRAEFDNDKPDDVDNSPARPHCSANSGYWPQHRRHSNETFDKANNIEKNSGTLNKELDFDQGDMQQSLDTTSDYTKDNKVTRNSSGSHDETDVKMFKRNAYSEERATTNDICATAKTSSQPSMKLTHTISSSCSDSESDVSLGEVFVPPDKSTQKHNKSDKKSKTRTKDNKKVKMRTKQDKSARKQRPISAEFVKSNSFHSASNSSCKTKMKIHSSPTLNSTVSQGNGGTPEKPKDVGFARVSKMLARAASERLSNDRVPSSTSVANSQQSSVIGIDWLFDTDSDSTGKTLSSACFMMFKIKQSCSVGF